MLEKKKQPVVYLSDDLMMTRDNMVISVDEYFKKASECFTPEIVKEIFQTIYDRKLYDPKNRYEGWTREQTIGSKFDCWFDSIFADLDESLLDNGIVSACELYQYGKIEEE